MGRGAKWLIASGAVLIAAALVFFFVGIPALVRFPLDTDQTAHYRGTFTQYLDQQTLQPLAQPLRVPLRVSRHVRAKSGGFSTVVVTEDDTIQPGPLTLHQHFQYVMNRRTMTLENDEATRMFSQPATSDVAGAIRVTFPFGTTRSGPYRMWSPETGKAVTLANGSAPHRLAGIKGPEVIDFSSSVEGPVSSSYSKWLSANGFPSSISPEQLASRLRVLGVDVPSVLATLRARLGPSQQALVTSALASPVEVDYRFFYTGTVAVDPTTGMMISSTTKTQGLDAVPSLRGLERLAPLLRPYADLPAVAELQGAINQLAKAPARTAVSYDYVQTPSSVQHLATAAENQGGRIHLVETVPWVVGGIGLVLIGIGLALTIARRRGAAAAPGGSVTSEPPDQRAA